jgi:hypothetical protein
LSFHKTCSNPFCTDFFPDCKKNVQRKAKFHLHCKVKRGFHCCDFHDTWNRRVSLRRDLLYQISPTLAEKYGK